MDLNWTVSLPDDYRLAYTLRVWGRDANSPSERVAGSTITKAAVLDEVPALIHMALGERAAECRVEATGPLDTEAVEAAQRIVTRMLGLESDPHTFEQQLHTQGDLTRLVQGREGLRVPLTATPWEGLTWAILGQQVNLAFAYSLRNALMDLCSVLVDEAYRAHPEPEAVAALDYADLTARKYSRRKAEYLIDVARSIAEGTLSLDDLATAPPAEVEQRLLAVRGLGPWSVNYVMMRAFGFPDCVPLGDTGLTSALQRFFGLERRPNAAETLALMEPFRPFRSLATFHLWMTGGVPT